MLLQRCIKSAGASALLLAVLLISGCASDGASKDAAAGSDPAVVGGSDKPNGVAGAANAELLEVPPQALTLFEQATAAMAAGDALDAELRFKEFLLQYPQFPGAHVNLAIIHANNDNSSAAQSAIDAALALDPNHPVALNQLGLLLRKNGKFLEAEAAYMKAVTVSPEYALAHYNLGVLNELYLQRLDSALRHFEIYQSLVGEDKQVERWIKDLTRRVAASQRTANVAD